MTTTNAQLAKAFKEAGQSLIKIGELFALAPSAPSSVEKSTPSRKRPKDKNAPGKNISSYLHYTKENRARIIKQNPGLSQPEIAVILGEEWRNLTEEQKEPYRAAAEKDKERFTEEMKTYSGSLQEDVPDADKKRKRTSAPAKSKASSSTISPTSAAPAAQAAVPSTASPSSSPETQKASVKDKKKAEKKKEKKEKKAKK